MKEKNKVIALKVLEEKMNEKIQKRQELNYEIDNLTKSIEIIKKK